MRKAFILAALLCTLTGCGESQAQDAVRDALKDPDSAKFGEFKVVDETGGKYACLVVNAKNSMGGYTGDQIATLSKSDKGEWEVLDISELSMDTCESVLKSVAKSPA